jgi:hypothetical protein
MDSKKEATRYVWPVIAILALVLIVYGSSELLMTEFVANYAFELFQSSTTMRSLDAGTVATISGFIRSSAISIIWFGIIGLLGAWGLKRKENFAWKLGVLWSILVLVTGLLIAGQEIFIANLSTICPDAIVHLIVGSIALVAILAVKKEFT